MGLSIFQYETRIVNGYWPLWIRWTGDRINTKLDTVGSISHQITSHCIPWYIPSKSHSFFATHFPWVLPPGIPQHTRCSRAKVEPLCSTSVWMGGRRVAAAWSVPDQRTGDGRSEGSLAVKVMSFLIREHGFLARQNCTSKPTKTWF